jgi:exosortase/archaeosortase family protein
MIFRTGGPAAIWLRIAGVVALLLAAFDLLEVPVRGVEAHAYAGLLRTVGFHGVSIVSGSSVYLLPSHQQPFWVTVSPSCSSLAPLLTLACLALLLPRAPGGSGWGRLALSYGAAAAAIMVGNLVRIDASIAAGLHYGVSTLVLFHDSAGTIFSFAYTLGGFMLMLWLQLPDLRRTANAGSAAAEASAIGAV